MIGVKVWHFCCGGRSPPRRSILPAADLHRVGLPCLRSSFEFISLTEFGHRPLPSRKVVLMLIPTLLLLPPGSLSYACEDHTAVYPEIVHEVNMFAAVLLSAVLHVLEAFLTTPLTLSKWC